MRFQQKDESLILIAKEWPNHYSIKQFYGTGKTYSVICRHRKIVIPKRIQKFLVELYHNALYHPGETNHNALYHPGETRTELTIGQHSYSKGLQKSIHNICSQYHSCQFLKHGKRHYSKLPLKQAETQPWDMLYIDLIGKYRMTSNKGGSWYAMEGKEKKNIYFQAITMIDPATSWIVLCQKP